MDEFNKPSRDRVILPFPGLSMRSGTSETNEEPGPLDLSFLPKDFAGSVDFRVDRIRRALEAGRTPESMTAASRKYTRGDSAEANYLIGRALSIVRDSEDSEPTRWWRAAADAGHVAASGALWERNARKNWTREFATLRRAAEAGDRHAARTLAYICRYWSGAPSVPYVKEFLLEEDARGDAFAALYLAEGYISGCSGPGHDHEKAFAFYARAAKAGNAEAQCALGVHFATGRGVQRDDERAVHWYQESARRGNAQGMGYLGYSYMVGRAPLSQSTREANRWYRRAALRGDAFAQYELGLSYLHARELTQSYTLANKWIGRAARAGLPAAVFELAQSYFAGRGIRRSYAKAANLYESAAGDGHVAAQCSYAYMLEAGLGRDKNLSEACRWYRAAAEQAISGPASSALPWRAAPSKSK